MKRNWIALVAVALLSCGRGKDLPRTEYQGYAQGTTWRVVIISEEIPGLDEELKQLFLDVDASLSLYVEESTISRFNHASRSSDLDAELAYMLESSRQVYEMTQGSFDPTVGPLVNAWGFHHENYQMLDSSAVDSIMRLVGLEKVHNNDSVVFKDVPGLELDLNGIAQGYTVDLIAELLQRHGLSRYLVEVGGEVRTQGSNQDDRPWRIGIDHPLSEERTFSAIVGISDRSLATSGNYRKFFVDKDSGQKYAHTIDPTTGFPVKNTLLSVSVVASDCLSADAFATAFMVMGVDRTRSWLEQNPGMDVYLIFSGKNGELKEWKTEGFDQLIVD